MQKVKEVLSHFHSACRFLLQSIHKLRQQLRACGSDLLVMRGPPSEQIPALVTRIGQDMLLQAVSLFVWVCGCLQTLF